MSGLLEATVEALRSLPPELTVFVISALPVFEVRIGVLVGIAHFKLPVAQVLLLGCLGNFASVTPVLLFLEPLSKWLYRNRIAYRCCHRLFAHAEKKADLINKWGALGLMVLTSVPLPGNGAWTAVVLALALSMHRWRALAATYAGIVISGTIVALLTMGGMAGIDHLRGTP